MFRTSVSRVGCREYELRLADYAGCGADSQLDEHLDQCANCRDALGNARHGSKLLRQAWEPAAEPGDTFTAGVMARIREEKRRAESLLGFWNPLEFLASRLALTAAMVLLALALYLTRMEPRKLPAVMLTGTELRASDFPQIPADPDSNEDVLASLSEGPYVR